MRNDLVFQNPLATLHFLLRKVTRTIFPFFLLLIVDNFWIAEGLLHMLQGRLVRVFPATQSHAYIDEQYASKHMKTWEDSVVKKNAWVFEQVLVPGRETLPCLFKGFYDFQNQPFSLHFHEVKMCLC